MTAPLDRVTGRPESVDRARSPMPGLRGRAPGLLWTVLAALLLLALPAPSVALAKAGGTRQDRAATRAYLEAQYLLDQSLVASAPASQAATEGVIVALGRECPGVLAGAPHDPLRTLFESLPQSRSPRQTGELEREDRQLNDLQGELELAFAAPAIGLDRQAALAYAHTVGSLRWSSHALTVLERGRAAELEWELQSPPPQVCTDMKAWATSGYSTLSSATKALIRGREAVIRALVHVLEELGLPSSDPLAGYEGAPEKALARKIAGLERVLRGVTRTLRPAEAELQRTLGVSVPETEAPSKGSVEIGHGQTAAGSSYTVWLEPKPERQCQLSLTVQETESSSASNGVIEASSFGTGEACLSRSHPEAPTVECRGEGLLTIEAQTLPDARSVRLHLSDGRQITSTVALVPAQLGGPAGFYYQVLRGPSPVPVSLTEVDADGTVLRTVTLPRRPKCVKQPPPKLIPSVVRTIAIGSLPHGP